MKIKLLKLVGYMSLIPLACASPKNEPVISFQCSVLCDVTDPHALNPAAAPILQLFQFGTDKGKEVFFRISSVTDKKLNPDIEFHLPSGNKGENENLQDDPYYREKTIIAFNQSVSNAIGNFSSRAGLDSPLRHSEVFYSIAKELQRIKSRPANKNWLLIFSDIQENSALFNCYLKASQERLSKNSEEVAALFNAAHLLPDDLRGVTIFFIYLPITREEDKRFEAIMGVYKLLLLPRGAIIKAQANNGNFES